MTQEQVKAAFAVFDKSIHGDGYTNTVTLKSGHQFSGGCYTPENGLLVVNVGNDDALKAVILCDEIAAIQIEA